MPTQNRAGVAARLLRGLVGAALRWRGELVLNRVTHRLAARPHSHLDEDVVHMLLGAFLAVGAALYLIPLIFAIESTSQGWLSGVASFLTSTSNPCWMAPILIVSMLGYGVIGGLIFQQVAIRGRRFGQQPEVREASKAA